MEFWVRVWLETWHSFSHRKPNAPCAKCRPVSANKYYATASAPRKPNCAKPMKKVICTSARLQSGWLRVEAGNVAELRAIASQL